jgi:hypothetical protein
MLHPTHSAPLHEGSSGATTTVPRATDNAQWLSLGVVASCVISAEALTTVLDSATQLVLVVIVLLLVRAQLVSPLPLGARIVKSASGV